MYKTFEIKNNSSTLKQPMFLGQNINVARYDQQKHKIFEHLTEMQLSFFWRPEEIHLLRDRFEFNKLSQQEKHIFIANLKYQILLDSVQGRSPNVAFLPIVSLPELETWIETWAWSETIHSRSYTHILRSLMDKPEIVFDNICNNTEIQKRAIDITSHYDELIQTIQIYNTLGIGKHKINGKVIDITTRDIKQKLYLTLHSVNALESIRFYVSFLCSFCFAENKKLEGCAKIIRFIARDEALHMGGTNAMLRIIHNNLDGDQEFYQVSLDLKSEAKKIFTKAIEQEKQWAKYLFKKESILGLNANVLCRYIDYLAEQRMRLAGFDIKNKHKENPCPWVNKYLDSTNLQNAPQETELTSYLTGNLKSDLSEKSFKNIKI